MLDLPSYMSSVIIYGGIVLLFLLFFAPLYLYTFKGEVNKKVIFFSFFFSIITSISLSSFNSTVNEYKKQLSQEDYFTTGSLSKICLRKKPVKIGMVTFKDSSSAYSCWDIDCKESTIRKCIEQINSFYQKEIISNR